MKIINKIENINLLNLNNDILNIIGGYVIRDNIKSNYLQQWKEMYKKQIIKYLDNEIYNFKSEDKTGEEIGFLILSKLRSTIFSRNEIYDFLSDRNLELETIERGRTICIFKDDEEIEEPYFNIYNVDY